MDKTIFELTPVENVEKLPAGEYIVVNKNNFPFLTPYRHADGWWQLDKPSSFTHYLRPLPPPVAEERTFTLAEMRKCWKSGRTYGRREVDEHYGGSENETPDFDECIKLITLPE